MASGFAIGYINFTIILLLLTGLCMLWIDVKTYERAKLEKEKKAARFLAWFNIVLAAVSYLGNYIYNSMQ